ncbi:MAG: hypothetical protein ACLGH8_06765 [Bacteroidia bacterium]
MTQGEHTKPQGGKTSPATITSTSAQNANTAAIMLFNTDRRFTITE